MTERVEGVAQRSHAVDTLRLVSVFAVIVIHSEPFGSGQSLKDVTGLTFAVVINQLARFAVPYFFVMSGYFFGRKLRSGASVTRVSTATGLRILVIFVCWSLIYLLPYDVWSIATQGFRGPFWVAHSHAETVYHRGFIALIFEGTKPHLWFLPSLLSIILIGTIFIRAGWIYGLVALSVFCYGFELLGGAYANTPVGIRTVIDTRDGPFFGLIFYTTGYFLSGFRSEARWLQIGLILVLLGFGMQFVELHLLMADYRTSPVQNCVVGTYGIGVGTALIALSDFKLLQCRVLSALGRISLGIYAIHFMFIDILHPFHGLSYGGDLLYTLAVALLSSVGALLLSSNRVTARLVS